VGTGPLTRDHRWGAPPEGSAHECHNRQARANPSKYPLGTAERYRKERPLWHLGAGRLAEEHGRLKQARQYYLQAWRFGGGLRPFALAVLSYFSAPVRRVARAVGHRLRMSPLPAGPHMLQGRGTPREQSRP
jgi:hypothetical protein